MRTTLISVLGLMLALSASPAFAFGGGGGHHAALGGAAGASGGGAVAGNTTAGGSCGHLGAPGPVRGRSRSARRAFPASALVRFLPRVRRRSCRRRTYFCETLGRRGLLPASSG